MLTQEQTAKDDPVLIELLNRKQGLAPEALKGNAKAKAEWDEVVSEIAEYELQLQMVKDAAAERERREAEKETQRLAAEREQNEQKLKTKQAELDEKRRVLDAAIHGLIDPINETIQTAKDVYGLTLDLGGTARFRIRDEIVTAIQSALSPALPQLGRVSNRSVAEFIDCVCGASYPKGATHNYCTAKQGSSPVGLTSNETFVGMSANGNHARVVDKSEVPALTPRPGETESERRARHAQLDRAFRF